jgi:hypothetical protein
MTGRVTAIREATKPIASAMRNAYIATTIGGESTR